MLQSGHAHMPSNYLIRGSVVTQNPFRSMRTRFHWAWTSATIESAEFAARFVGDYLINGSIWREKLMGLMGNNQKFIGAYFRVIHPAPSASFYVRPGAGSIFGQIPFPVELPQISFRYNLRSAAQPTVWNQIRVPGVPEAIVLHQRIDPAYAVFNYRSFALAHFVDNDLVIAQFPPAVVDRLGTWSTFSDWYLWDEVVTQDQRRVRR